MVSRWQHWMSQSGTRDSWLSFMVKTRHWTAAWLWETRERCLLPWSLPTAQRVIWPPLVRVTVTMWRHQCNTSFVKIMVTLSNFEVGMCHCSMTSFIHYSGEFYCKFGFTFIPDEFTLGTNEYRTGFLLICWGIFIIKTYLSQTTVD